jgi:hypothetical protein
VTRVLAKGNILRVAKTSRLVSALSILGLIVCSAVIVLILNSSSLVNPTLPFQKGKPNGDTGPTGTLAVQLYSNDNQTEKFAHIVKRAFPPSPQFFLANKALEVTQATNSSSPLKQSVVTNTHGHVELEEPPGAYVVNLMDESLNISIPVRVFAGNETDVVVDIYGAAYPLNYSEETGVRPSNGIFSSIMYAELRSSAPVANLSEAVILEVHGATPDAGYTVNATVISRESPGNNTQWMQLGALQPINPVNATSMVLTTWTYRSAVSVTPNRLIPGAS